MPCESHPPLTDQELDTMECRARAYSGAYTGTSLLAADVLLLLREQHSIERYQQQRGRD